MIIIKLNNNSTCKLYDKDGYYMKRTTIANFTLRTQDLPYDDYMVGLTHGMYIQPSGRFEDYAIHPEMSEVALGQHQQAFDLASSDINNGKYLGMAPYIQYRDYCSGYTKNLTKFEDLLDVIESHKIIELQDIYRDPVDIELMTGCYAEKLLQGTWVTPTVYCLLVEQLKKEQLQEIRKASLAGLLCAVGDDVTQVQHHAFQTISAKNPIVSCSEIPEVDLTLWRDDSCNEAS